MPNINPDFKLKQLKSKFNRESSKKKNSGLKLKNKIKWNKNQCTTDLPS